MVMLSVYWVLQGLSYFFELLPAPFLKRYFVDIELQFSFVGRIRYYLRRYPLDRKFTIVFFGV